MFSDDSLKTYISYNSMEAIFPIYKQHTPILNELASSNSKLVDICTKIENINEFVQVLNHLFSSLSELYSTLA